MVPILIGVGAFFSWILLCLLSVFLATVFSVVMAKKLEHYLVITDRWTFWIWIVTLAISPGVSFLGNFVVWGMFLPREYYDLVRLGWLTGGISVAVAIIVFLLLRDSKESDKSSEWAMGVGALLVDLTFCGGLIWSFESIATFMHGFQ